MTSGDETKKGQSIWLVSLAIVGVLAALVILTPLGWFIFIPIQMAKIRRVEKRMQSPEVYEAVATNLALYCQSVHVLQITNMLGSPRLPQPLPQLGSPWGTFESNYAHVEFGGGFYHYGYRLQLDQSASSLMTNTWELRFVAEDREKLLHRFSLSTAAQISRGAFLKNSLAEYNARIARSPRIIALHRAKIDLLSQYDRGQMHSACLAAIKDMPDHWWPRLTLALLDTGAGRFDEASSNLVNFVTAEPSYSRYMYLAYFYQLTEKPDEAAKAVERAITFPIIDLPDDHTNTECRGYSVGVYLYHNGRYATTIKLCDALLPLRINGNYAKAALRNLKASAESALSGATTPFTPDDAVRGFNAYENFDIQSLLSP